MIQDWIEIEPHQDTNSHVAAWSWTPPPPPPPIGDCVPGMCILVDLGVIQTQITYLFVTVKGEGWGWNNNFVVGGINNEIVMGRGQKMMGLHVSVQVIITIIRFTSELTLYSLMMPAGITIHQVNSGWCIKASFMKVE